MQDQPQLPIDFGPCTRVFSTLFITRPGAHLVSDFHLPSCNLLEFGFSRHEYQGWRFRLRGEKTAKDEQVTVFFSRIFMDLFHAFANLSRCLWICSMVSQQFSVFFYFNGFLLHVFAPFFRIFHGISPNYSPF